MASARAIKSCSTSFQMKLIESGMVLGGGASCASAPGENINTMSKACQRFLTNPPAMNLDDLVACWLVLVAVMMCFRALADRNHAAMGHFADYVLELDRGVVDTEVAQQALFHVAQDALAHRRGNVGNRDVAGERVGFRPNAP